MTKVPHQGIGAWASNGTGWSAWEDRLSELADYRKIHGHCNVPGYSENTKLASLGRNPKETQVAPRRKDIAYDKLPYPGLESLV
jgi:hypothetical protein